MRGGRGLKFYMLSSFFGAAMIAATYAYFNYKFSQFNHIDFSKTLFYSKDAVFVPDKENYTVIVFSSKKDDIEKLSRRLIKKDSILALDLAGVRFDNTAEIEYATSGINTFLPIINRFRIYEVPVVFDIKRVNKNNFKQSSKIEYFH